MSGKIYKGDVARRLSERTGRTNSEAARQLQEVLDVIDELLQENDRVTLRGWGTLEVRPTPARNIRVISGEDAGRMRTVPASYRVAFAPSAGLTEKIRAARK